MAVGLSTHLKDIPYCETASKPDFQTSVTSQAFVACSLHDRNAETALPPTTQYMFLSLGAIIGRPGMATWSGFKEGG